MDKITKSFQKRISGTVTPGLLVISSAFIIAIYAILFVLTVQFDFSQRQVASEQAFYIAEAGINYYAWHLFKNPNDYKDGTTNDPPYIHDYSDPQGAKIGQYSLNIIPPDANNIVTVESTGSTDRYPKVKRTIVAKYGKVSLSSFAFVVNTNLWFGKDITVNGIVHSNGGIRQDGTNTSYLKSAKSTYTCGIESGCTNPETKPGIWGTGKEESLWQFPVPPIDYDGLNIDFANIKVHSQTSEGVYLPPGALGYHVVFSNDGTFNVYEVTGKNYLKAFSSENGCESLYQIITSETLLGSYQTADKDVVFAEADVWVEGIVNGVITVAAAQFPLGSYVTNIFIPNDLTYVDLSGNSRLGVIAQTDIIFTRNVPDYFDIHGALVAKDGRVIRHHYNYFGCRESGAGADSQKNEFNFLGTIITNKRSYWNFSSGAQSPASGFVKSVLTFDANMGNNPAPYFPSDQYRLLSWEEK